MYIELRCKKCNNLFHIDFDNKEVSINSCPHCGAYFNGGHISHLAEIYYIAQTHSNENVEIIALSNGKKNIVFDTDIANINNIFNTAPEEVKTQMTRLFDLFYLLLFRDAKNCNIETLENTIKEVRKVYNRKVGHPEDFLIDSDYESQSKFY